MIRYVTRYAPSPTGELHIGGVRTALFCYLFAKKHHGSFLIRTDDTDTARNSTRFINGHIHQLSELGIVADASILKPDKNGPYLQSQRLAYYQKFVKQLIERKRAYYCFCTQAELASERQLFYEKFSSKDYVYSQKCRNLSEKIIAANIRNKKNRIVRFRADLDTDVTYNDLVFNKLAISKSEISDFVLIKTNQMPSYNFACVIDDHLMKISHVIRGCEHLSNTWQQLVLYKSLDFCPPQFAHLSLIIDAKGKKLSKRAVGSKSLQQLITDGILPSALLNFMAFLGWQPDKKKEIFSVDELITKFNIKQMTRAPAVFNFEKLYWFNKQYIQQLSETEFRNYLQPFTSLIAQINPLARPLFYTYYQARVNSHHDFVLQVNTILKFAAPNKKNTMLRNKYNVEIAQIIIFIRIWFADGDHQLTSSIVARDLIDFISWKTSYLAEQLYVPIRLILNNVNHGLSLELLLLFLGEKEILKRVDKV